MILDSTPLPTGVSVGQSGHVGHSNRVHAWINMLMGVTKPVTAFGATGDGVTDDTVAIQAAIDAAATAGGGVVYFPQGTFKTSGTLTVTSSNMVLMGAGKSSTISYQGSGAAVQYGTKTGSALTRCGFSRLSVAGTSSGTVGILWIAVQFSFMENFYVDGFTASGARGVIWDSLSASPYTACIDNSITGRSEVSNCANGFRLTQDAASNRTDGSNHNTITGLRVASFSGIGIDVDAGENNVFLGCDSSTGTNGATGVRINDDVNSFFQIRTDNSFGVGNTATGIRLTANARDHVIIQPTGNGATTRILYDDPTISGFVFRDGFNVWGENIRRTQAATGSDRWIARAWKNADSVDLSANNVAYFDATCGEGEVKRVSAAGQPNPLVAVEAVTAGATGGFAEPGSVVSCSVDTGAVAVGDALVSSASAGRAKADNTVTNARYILGIARSSKAAGSTGTVKAYIR